MVLGLVCTEVDGSSDVIQQLTVVKDSLTLSIPHIVPIQVGSYSQPETAHTNPEGGSLLKSFRKMETQVQRLLGKSQNSREEARNLKEETRNLREENQQMTKELTLLRPLKERFFTTFQQRREFHRIGDHTAIRVGNEVAHEGDVTSDVCLLENGLIQYFSALKALYGFDCKEAKVFLVFPHMVTAMDKRATALARVDGRWKLEVEFQMLAKWTQTATAEGLGGFIVGQVGANYYKNLFLKLRYNG
ncbi:hypothetical protein HOY82DRAFT_634775 [Tuber indicum]|nr:hypothetical protein HOY82DRAFT_634775 [Tuber indicum]